MHMSFPYLGYVYMNVIKTQSIFTTIYLPGVVSIVCVMTAAINEKLSQLLKEGQNWEKKATNIQGVFLLKLPASKQSQSSIAIEINPTNATPGSVITTRKKGIIIRDGFELEQFSQLLSNPKVIELAKKIETINPRSKDDTASSSSSNKDVFEI